MRGGLRTRRPPGLGHRIGRAYFRTGRRLWRLSGHRMPATHARRGKKGVLYIQRQTMAFGRRLYPYKRTASLMWTTESKAYKMCYLPYRVP